MHSISYFWHLSRLIYGPRNFQENKRAVVFLPVPCPTGLYLKSSTISLTIMSR